MNILAFISSSWHKSGTDFENDRKVMNFPEPFCEHEQKTSLLRGVNDVYLNQVSFQRFFHLLFATIMPKGAQCGLNIDQGVTHTRRGVVTWILNGQLQQKYPGTTQHESNYSGTKGQTKRSLEVTLGWLDLLLFHLRGKRGSSFE